MEGVEIIGKFTKYEEDFIRENYLNMSDKEIAEILGRTESSICDKRSKHMKLKKGVNISGFLKEKEIKKNQVFEEIVLYVKSTRDSELLSNLNEYKSYKSNLKFRCNCGEIFYTSFDSFKYRNKTKCNECKRRDSNEKQKYDFEYVKKVFSDLNYTIVDEYYINNET